MPRNLAAFVILIRSADWEYYWWGYALDNLLVDKVMLYLVLSSKGWHGGHEIPESGSIKID